ncbi:MAG: hypothetical protein ACQEV7_11380 [Bacillota bacterium]
MFAVGEGGASRETQEALLTATKPPSPAPPKKNNKNSWSDMIHTGLDIAGFIPIFGAVADGANALMYAVEGDYANAALNVGAMVPGIGDGAKAAAMTAKAAGGGYALLKGANKGTGKYQVGAYKDIKGVEGLDAHHVGQKALMKDLVENYDLNTAPAINVPKIGHTIKGPNGIVSRSTVGIDNPRQLLARDIMELRRVYDDIPNSALKELIELNKNMYPEMRK